MSASITHSTVVVVADDGTSPVGTNEWNANHTLSNVAASDGTLAQFASTTSLELKGVISDETGSGALVFATSPTLVTPLLGTPTSGVLTNCTGTASGLTAGTVTTNANLTGDVTSVGNASTLATVNSNVGSFTSANITVNAKGLVTAAANGSGGSGLTIGTSAITSGTATRLLYETSGNVVGEISGATSNGTALTLVAPVLGTPASGTLTSCTGLPPAGVVGTAAILGANTFTAKQTITQASADAGIVASTGYSVTGSGATNMLDFDGTWNTSGSPRLLKLHVADTASGAGALLMEVIVDTTTIFSVSKTGFVRLGPAARIEDDVNGTWSLQTGNFLYKSSYLLNWSNDTHYYGTIDLALGRTAAGVLEVSNGTPGTLRDIKLRNVIAPDANGAYIQHPGMTVANLPAAPARGMRCYVTDSNAASMLAAYGLVLAGGGSTVTPAFYDGTNWRGG